MASTAVLEALFYAAGALPTAAQLSDMREALCAFVDAAKHEGQRQEQIVVQLRAAARKASPNLPDSVLEALVAECLKRYYARE